jgi:hypothetical protein
MMACRRISASVDELPEKTCPLFCHANIGKFTERVSEYDN